MAEIKSINGYSLKDETARNEIENIKNNYPTNEDFLAAMPTNVSAFNNDAGYLTEIPNEYVTDSELSAKGFLTKHQSLDGYATEYYVDEKIRMIESTQGPQGEQGEQGPQGEKGADGITPVKGVDYFTEADKAEMLNGYATEQFVNDAISNLEIPEGGGDVDLSNYVTKDETIGTISGTISSFMETSLTSKLPEGLHLFKGVTINCKLTETATFATPMSLEDDIVRVSHYDDTNHPNVEDGTYRIITELYCYGSSTTYKFYVKKPELGFGGNSIILLSEESNTTDLSGYATEQYVQDAIGNLEIPEPDLSDYATKEEVKNNVSSTTITRIEVVPALPSIEEDGVLYIVKSE